MLSWHGIGNMNGPNNAAFYIAPKVIAAHHGAGDVRSIHLGSL